jgi:hypothetical protein
MSRISISQTLEKSQNKLLISGRSPRYVKPRLWMIKNQSEIENSILFESWSLNTSKRRSDPRNIGVFSAWWHFNKDSV